MNVESHQSHRNTIPYHEIFYRSMEHGTIVIAIGAVPNEILARFRHNIAIQFQIQRTVWCVQSYVALLLDAFVAHFTVLEDSRLRIVDGHHCRRCETGRHRTGRIMGRIEFIERRLLCTAATFIARLWLVIAFQLIQNIPRFGWDHLQSSLRVFPFKDFLFRFDAQSLANVMESRNVELFQSVWILYRDYVFPNKRCVVHQIFPILRFDVQLLYGLVREHIARRFDRNDVRILCEWLEQWRAMVGTFVVLVEIQLNQRFGVARFPRDRVHFECLQKVDDCAQLENISLRVAIGYFERSHCDCAKIEWQSFEFDVLILCRLDFFAAVKLRPLRVRQVPANFDRGSTMPY